MSNVVHKIAGKLKALRQERGWSLDVTSAQTGVSKAMLGQIERGESNPTIATLWKIASGFDVSFSFFIEEATSAQEHVLLVTKGFERLNKKDSKIRVLSVVPFDEQLNFEVFTIELLPGCVHLSPPHQKGVIEHVVPIRGSVEVLVQEEWVRVDKNQGFRFFAEQPHGYRNLSEETVVFQNIIHYR